MIRVASLPPYETPPVDASGNWTQPWLLWLNQNFKYEQMVDSLSVASAMQLEQFRDPEDEIRRIAELDKDAVQNLRPEIDALQVDAETRTSFRNLTPEVDALQADAATRIVPRDLSSDVEKLSVESAIPSSARNFSSELEDIQRSLALIPAPQQPNALQQSDIPNQGIPGGFVLFNASGQIVAATSTYLGLDTLPPIYATNAAAVLGGLIAGTVYRTGALTDLLCIVH